MLDKFDLKLYLLVHLFILPFVYTPFVESRDSLHDLDTSDSVINGIDSIYSDDESDLKSKARDHYANHHSEGYQGGGWTGHDSDKGSYEKGQQGHASYDAAAHRNEASGLYKHSEGSKKTEQDRIIKHEWDRGGGYVKEWNWDKGVHYERDSASSSAKDKATKESGHVRQSGEHSKGSSGYNKHQTGEHERHKAGQSYGHEGHRQASSVGDSNRYKSGSDKNRDHKYYTDNDGWIEKPTIYSPLDVSAARPIGLIRSGISSGRPIEYRTVDSWTRDGKRSKEAQRLSDVIRTKYMPIYEKYWSKSPGQKSKGHRRGWRYTNNHKDHCSRSRYEPGRWKLGHLFGSGLDSILPTVHYELLSKATKS